MRFSDTLALKSTAIAAMLFSAGCLSFDHPEAYTDEFLPDETTRPATVRKETKLPSKSILHINDGAYLIENDYCPAVKNLLEILPELPKSAVGKIKVVHPRKLPKAHAEILSDAGSPWIIVVRDNKIVDKQFGAFFNGNKNGKSENIRVVMHLLARNQLISDSENDFLRLVPAQTTQKGIWAWPGLSGRALAALNFAGHSISDADFEGSVMSGSNFEGAKLSHVDFRGATLSHVSFEDAEVTNSNFSEATFLNTTCPSGRVVNEACPEFELQREILIQR